MDGRAVRCIDAYNEWVDAGNGTDEDRQVVGRFRAALADLRATWNGIVDG